jgi:hypothetical protein
VKRDGVYWIAKTREEWCEETCLTLRQYRRCISVLIERGLIEMQVKRFKGVAICHVRLLIDSLEKSLNELRQEGQKVTPTKAQTSLLGGTKGQVYITETTTETTTESKNSEQPQQHEHQKLKNNNNDLTAKIRQKAKDLPGGRQSKSAPRDFLEGTLRDYLQRLSKATDDERTRAAEKALTGRRRACVRRDRLRRSTTGGSSRTRPKQAQGWPLVRACRRSDTCSCIRQWQSTCTCNQLPKLKKSRK